MRSPKVMVSDNGRLPTMSEGSEGDMVTNVVQDGKRGLGIKYSDGWKFAPLDKEGMGHKEKKLLKQLKTWKSKKVPKIPRTGGTGGGGGLLEITSSHQGEVVGEITIPDNQGGRVLNDGVGGDNIVRAYTIVGDRQASDETNPNFPANRRINVATDSDAKHIVVDISPDYQVEIGGKLNKLSEDPKPTAGGAINIDGNRTVTKFVDITDGSATGVTITAGTYYIEMADTNTGYYYLYIDDDITGIQFWLETGTTNLVEDGSVPFLETVYLLIQQNGVSPDANAWTVANWKHSNPFVGGSFPAIRWAGGTAPTLSTGNGKIDLVQLQFFRREMLQGGADTDAVCIASLINNF